MKSPFPGMDPFIEMCDLWGDFQSALIGGIRNAITDELPLRYVVRSGYREYTELLLPAAEQALAPAAIAPEPALPVSMRAFIEHDHKEKFLDIVELQPERRLVTRLEVLSPSNKKRRSPGWKKYLRKRNRLLQGEANFVEIDLLRDGDRMPMLDPWPASPYRLLVSREERAPYCRVWPGFFDRPLPVIPIPVSRPDPDLILDLQSIVDGIYVRSRYGEEIDYTQPLLPPLSLEEAAWVAQRLRQPDA